MQPWKTGQNGMQRTRRKIRKLRDYDLNQFKSNQQTRWGRHGPGDRQTIESTQKSPFNSAVLVEPIKLPKPRHASSWCIMHALLSPHRARGTPCRWQPATRGFPANKIGNLTSGTSIKWATIFFFFSLSLSQHATAMNHFQVSENGWLWVEIPSSLCLR